MLYSFFILCGACRQKVTVTTAARRTLSEAEATSPVMVESEEFRVLIVFQPVLMALWWEIIVHIFRMLTCSPASVIILLDVGCWMSSRPSSASSSCLGAAGCCIGQFYIVSAPILFFSQQEEVISGGVLLEGKSPSARQNIFRACHIFRARHKYLSREMAGRDRWQQPTSTTSSQTKIHPTPLTTNIPAAAVASTLFQ